MLERGDLRGEVVEVCEVIWGEQFALGDAEVRAERAKINESASGGDHQYRPPIATGAPFNRAISAALNTTSAAATLERRC
jgi:hypothetical protein